MNYLKRGVRKVYNTARSSFSPGVKKDVELSFWKDMIEDYTDWYNGKIQTLYGEKTPDEKDKVKVRSVKDSAILTWFKTHQKTKYLEDLMLPKDAFKNMKLLDIGSGPIPSALAFEDCEVYNLDPLLAGYMKIGYPTHYYDRARFISSPSENIPVEDSFFDAVISVNAIDHVDDFYKTAAEIKRVLKPEGKLRLHVHYHKKNCSRTDRDKRRDYGGGIQVVS